MGEAASVSFKCTLIILFVYKKKNVYLCTRLGTIEW